MLAGVMVVVGIGGIIYYSLPHKLVVKPEGFEFWVGRKMKFCSDYDEIDRVECKKGITNLARVSVPDSHLYIHTTRGTLMLSAKQHLSKKSLMTFMRKLEEKSFEHRHIEIKDRLNWLYQ
jgi:hypothetical protein